MWPMLLDMSRDECKRILRRLELEAYASIITAFRAQGALTKEKKNLLKEIASELNISMERHRAEVRRAVNDEKLATIAEHMAGPDTGTEWAIVGRRLVPLMPRLVPQTAFTVIANSVANLTAAGNARLPVPAATAKLPGSGCHEPESTLSLEPVFSEASRTPHGSPDHPSHAQSESQVQKLTVDTEMSSDNVTAVPEINIKRELDEEEEERCGHKRIKTVPEGEAEVTSSICTTIPVSQPGSAAPCSQPTSKQAPALTVAVSTSCQSSSVTSTCVSSSAARAAPSIASAPVPVKITLSSSTTWPTSSICSTTSGTTQKVIIVSSSGSCGSPSILQRSLSVPVVKTVTSVAPSPSATITSSTSSSHSRGPTSYIINNGSSSSSSQSGTVVTISTGSASENPTGPRSSLDCSMTATTVSIDGVPTAAYISSGGPGGGVLPGNSVSILGSSSSASSGSVVHKLRPKAQGVSIGGISRPRTGPIVIPVTPNAHHPLHQSLTCAGATGITVQPKSKSLLGAHVAKQEGSSGSGAPPVKAPAAGMKILPISGVANSGGSMAKILPKPAKGSSLFVVNASGSTTTTASQMSVVSRVVPTSVLSPSTSLNLPTSSISVIGSRNIATGSSSRINLNATAVARSSSSQSSLSSTLPSTGSQPTTSASTVHQVGRAATVTSACIPPAAASAPAPSSLGGKSNVIVVQKGPSGSTTFCRGVSLGATTKELVGKVLKGKTAAITVQRRPVPSSNTSASNPSNSMNVKNGSGLNLPTSSSQGNVIVLDLSNEQIGNSSILNELLHGSGIIADSVNLSTNGVSGPEDVTSDIHATENPQTPEADISQDICHVPAEAVQNSALNISQTRVVTLEEAVEMFGTSVGDNGEILLGKKACAHDDVSKVVHVSTSAPEAQEILAGPPVEAEVVLAFDKSNVI